MTIIVCELEINNFTTCDQWNMETFKKGYSFSSEILPAGFVGGKWMTCEQKDVFFAWVWKGKIIFIAFILFASFTKQ